MLDALHHGFSYGMTGVHLATGAFLLIGFIASVSLARVAGGCAADGESVATVEEAEAFTTA